QMGSREGLALRQLALEALEKSTKMFEVAFKLQTQGNQVEAERVRTMRERSAISTILMTEANYQEVDSNSVSSQRCPGIINFSAQVRH
ncbi:MAG: hypothetical protein ACR2G5_13370, partial [Pyrinomonadaceae bacterium]